jgi:hypothetical protein
VVEFTDWDGGFTDVSFLNTLTVDFEGAAAEPEPGGDVIFYYESPPSILATVAGEAYEELSISSVMSIVQLAGADALALSGGSDNVLRYVYYQWNGETAVSVGAGLWTLEIFGRLSDSEFNLPDFGSVGFVKRAALEIVLGDFSNNFAFIDMNYLEGQSIVDPDFDVNTRVVIDGSTVDRETTVVTKQQLTSLGHLSIQRVSATNCVAHYNGQQVMSWTIDESDEFLPIVTIQSISRNVPLVTTGQARLTIGQARYGTGTFTPPSTAFFTP